MTITKKNASGCHDIDKNAYSSIILSVFSTEKLSKVKYSTSTYKRLIITMMVMVLFFASFLGPVEQEKQNYVFFFLNLINLTLVHKLYFLFKNGASLGLI